MRLITSILVLWLCALSAQAQQVYRCLNQARTELEYSDKPCPEGAAGAARIDVTPNSAATAATGAPRSTSTQVAPLPPSGPVNNPFKDADEAYGEASQAWAKGNAQATPPTTFDQSNMPAGQGGRPSR